MQKFHGYIFDMDGVVVDNHKYHFKAWMEFSAKYRFHLNDEIYREKFNGKTNRDLFKMIFGDLTEEKIQSLSLEKELRYQDIYKSEIMAHSGLIDFLKQLQSMGAKVALGTSAPTMNVDFTLDHLGLRDFFHVIIDGPQVTQGKPHPEVYLKCVHELGLSPEDCVVFEDSLAGLEAGKQAGCHIVGVTTSHSRAELLSKTHDLIEDFFQARDLLGI
jgi:beta-phosphoglucomutase family hydrolase